MEITCYNIQSITPVWVLSILMLRRNFYWMSAQIKDFQTLLIRPGEKPPTSSRTWKTVVKAKECKITYIGSKDENNKYKRTFLKVESLSNYNRKLSNYKETLI